MKQKRPKITFRKEGEFYISNEKFSKITPRMIDAWWNEVISSRKDTPSTNIIINTTKVHDWENCHQCQNGGHNEQ